MTDFIHISVSSLFFVERDQINKIFCPGDTFSNNSIYDIVWNLSPLIQRNRPRNRIDVPFDYSLLLLILVIACFAFLVLITIGCFYRRKIL